ncbi:DUF4097 family beta strand repeat-containing protein [Nonomuraea turcica]|uniref:DUF4097 family beta strand repeat-containing protein n=1 Tax=Nonomuraea sp. G32 TaxID=3067274 RepID=UPI00273AE3BD|nr:DUF4097 family beta strand repeat-containing protein [Nonomuraea sp. G32]MDP4507311.1 DUF4097 family beta strand repeat-containing protein [Nonomuraea sp. G32]
MIVNTRPHGDEATFKPTESSTMTTFDTPEPITATIDIETGHVTIRADDRATTLVQVRPSDAASDADVQAAVLTTVEYAHGRLKVQAPKNKLRSLFGRPPSIEVTIELPHDSHVDATTAAGFHSHGRLGAATAETAIGSIHVDHAARLKLRTGVGDVAVTWAEGLIDATTSSGNIQIGAVDGTAIVTTASGDITIGEATGDLRLEAIKGDIAVTRALAAVIAKASTGDIRIGQVTRGTIVLETRRGQVELGVKEGSATKLDLNTSHGKVHNELSETAETGEIVDIRARTGMGDIVLRRA